MARPIFRGWVLLVILHFIVQVALQGVTLRDNKQAKNATGLCLSLAHVPVGLPLLEGDDLSICDGIPEHSNVTCILVASAGTSLLTSLTNVDTNFLTGFDLDGIHSITLSGDEHFITGRCVLSLQWINDMWVIKVIFGPAPSDIMTAFETMWPKTLLLSASSFGF